MGLDVPALLNASHIVPWAALMERRADPRNCVCRIVLLDRAFDRGLISFTDDLAVIVSARLRAENHGVLAAGGLVGKRLRLPRRFEPDRGALAWHRVNVYRG